MKGSRVLRIAVAAAVGTTACVPLAQAASIETPSTGSELPSPGDASGSNPGDPNEPDSPTVPGATDSEGPDQTESLDQLLALKPKSGSYFTLLSTSAKSTCIGAPKGSVMASTRLALAKSKKLASQKWQFKSAGQGYYYLICAKSRKALTVADSKRPAGSALVQRKLAKTNAQKWTIKGTANSCYLVSKNGSGLCLTAGAKKGGTASLRLKSYSATSEQRFILKKTSYKLTKNALLDSLSSAKGSSAITGFGGASFDKKSKAGKRLSRAPADVRRSSGTCAFTMVDLETGAGIASNANQVVYSASTIKGPYVTAICKYRAGSIDGSARGHINSVAAWSSNDDYKALRSRFGSAPMASLMRYSHVREIPSSSTWVSYSPKTLGKLWVGSYWLNFKDSNKNSSYLRGKYKKGARSFIKAAVGARKSTTTYTKTGWGPFSRSGNIYNDAGIVVKNGHPYMIAVMSKAYYHPDQLRELVRAIDAYEEYLRS